MGVLIPTKTSITSDCKTLTITDTTDYVVLGTARNLLYLKLIVRLRKSTGDENITVPAYNENTAATWTATLAEDGWYEVYLFGCLIYNAGTSYGLDWITYDAATDEFYVSVVANNLGNAVTNVNFWTPAGNDPSIYSKAIASPVSQPTTHEGTLNIVELCRSYNCEGKMLLKAKCDCKNDCNLQEYEKIRMKIEAAIWNDGLGNYSEAQEIIENLTEVCNNLEDCGCA